MSNQPLNGDVLFDKRIGDKEKGLWNYSDAASFLGVSVRTLKRSVKERTIPFAVIRGSVRFCPWVLHVWAENGGSR